MVPTNTGIFCAVKNYAEKTELSKKTPYIALYFAAFWNTFSSIISKNTRGYPQFSFLDSNSPC